MNIKDFRLERYFAQHEFSAKYLLSSSDCDGFAMSYVLEQATPAERKLWDSIQLGYSESKGRPQLREAILQYYNLNDIENVVVASPGELNFSAMNLLLQAGDHVITVSPAYQSLFEIAKSLTCEISYWRPRPEGWTFHPEDLRPLIQKNTKLIIINFPHNPTGSYLSLDQMKEIVAIAEEHDLYIFSDEMYHKLVHKNRPELPPMSDLYRKGISLWGTSKTMGLAGLRLGWLVSQDQDFINRIEAFKDYLSICNNGPSEILTLIALNHLDQFLQPNLKKIRANVALFSSFVEQHDIFSSFIPPQAGSTAFVPIQVEGTAKQFSDQLVMDTGIMTVPAEMFEYSGNYIRVGFGRKDMPELLEVFDAYLKSN